ncbi:type I-F CRISPR-associated protein Csy3 [Endozoicomonas sp. ONNA2]|uniref:type I-F CRISPR-associated protein Csy3 n=1 Tax=Endozoicomonas sp. ONNA2 TaxID=2828741 RepID=UPI002148C077|nr:type I-F CRISPR-associated protein Csy3 [Endozoicomonas sp. ONNA2]
MAKIELPTMLNYTRSIVPSNGIFTCMGDDGQIQPVLITRQTVRGTISNFSGIDRSGKKAEQEKEKLLDPNNANIQSVDVCYLPETCDRFRLEYSLTFTSQSLRPGACNAPDFFADLEKLAHLYRDLNGFSELATRYLTNIINGRWMWRNRYATDKKVTVRHEKTETSFQVENAFDHDYGEYQGFLELRDKIASALAGNDLPLRLNVIGQGNLGAGQEVYPSQEFADSKDGKVLAAKACPAGKQAMMHSQKIGNAIRTIDTWHSKAKQYGAIAIEPYGVVQQRAEAVRLPSTNQDDLYTYLMNIKELIEALEKGSVPEHIHYVMACLIRGGVFSGKSKKNK